jgi:hypothetical protein
MKESLARAALANAKTVGGRLGNFVVSVACGIGVPLAPLEAERWVKGEIDSVSWLATGVTYVAAIGLVSSSSAILIVSLLGAAALAFVYGVNMEMIFAALHEHPPHQLPPPDASFARVGIEVMSVIYLAERTMMHLIDNKPFLEV